MIEKIKNHLGKEADDLLNHRCVFPKEKLHLPGPDFVERIWLNSDINPRVTPQEPTSRNTPTCVGKTIPPEFNYLQVGEKYTQPHKNALPYNPKAKYPDPAPQTLRLHPGGVGGWNAGFRPYKQEF